MRRVPNNQQSFPDDYSFLAALGVMSDVTVLARQEEKEVLQKRCTFPATGYVSFTIWETKKDFTFWRKGPAFKEAHGGGGILD